MMVRVFSVFLIVLSLFLGFQQAIIVMHFKLNQERIEKAYCVNKNRPGMECHGLCHLRKQLDSQEQSDAANIKNYPRVELFVVSVFEYKIDETEIESAEEIILYQEENYKEPMREIFIPPPIIMLV